MAWAARCNRAVQILYLDDEGVESARIDRAGRGLVNELDTDELVVGKLQHRQAAKRGVGHGADDVVSEGRVEGERSFEILDPQADVQRPHDGSPVGCSVVGKTRWVTLSPWMHTVGSPRRTSSIASSPK